MATQTAQDYQQQPASSVEPGVHIGGPGNDQITGGPGTDLVEGGPGNDRLAGGKGRDFFYWHYGDLSGTDHVLDFQLGEDVLVFDGLKASNLSLATAGANTIIKAHDTEGAVIQSIVLEGVALREGDTDSAKLQWFIDQRAILFDHYDEDECEDVDEEEAEQNAATQNHVGYREVTMVQQTDLTANNDSEQESLRRLIDVDAVPLTR